MFKGSDDIIVERQEYGVYNIRFSFMNNNNVNIKNIIGVDFMKVVYELNKDLIDEIKINKIDNNNGEYYLKLRHLFEDLGFPQFYSTVRIHIDRKDKEILIKGKTDEIELSFDKSSEIVKGPNFNMDCSVLSPNESRLDVKIIFKLYWDNIPITDFLEKISIKITKKIIKRLKEFVYNLIIYK